MVVLGLLAVAALIALIFGPQYWVRSVMARHGASRPDFPGTGAELARHLLDEAGLKHVQVERIQSGDHYSPDDRAVRLSVPNHDGRSVTAVAVAAHEVGHAIQDAQGYRPLMLRQSLARYGIAIERTGGILMFAAPLVFALTRSPLAMLAEMAIALVVLSSTVLIHAATLPTEYDASFNRALPVLSDYLKPADMPAAQSVLKAAALTYVAAALMSLVDIARWLRLLRF